MKKIFSIVAGFLALTLGFRSTAQPKSEENNKSLLWRISGKDLKKPSYLFGTIHIICKDDFLWTAKMKESLEKSEKVCFEMNLSDPNVMTEATTLLLQSMMKKMMGDMGPETMKMLEGMLSDSAMKGKALGEQFDPNALKGMMGGGGFDCANTVSYEDSIMSMVKPTKKPIMGLETPQEQVAVFETLPLDSMLSMIMETLQGGGKGDSEHSSAPLIAAYKNQDLPALYKLLSGDKGSSLDLGIFLDDRNTKWIPRMKEKMKASNVFFAVGAGHLLGTSGVIALLRKDGYTVEPIR